MEGIVTLSGMYVDNFTNSTNPTYLLAIRTILNYPTYRKLIEVEVFQETLINYLMKIYYVPSAEIVFLKIKSTLDSSLPIYEFINVNNSNLDLSTCL